MISCGRMARGRQTHVFISFHWRAHVEFVNVPTHIFGIGGGQSVIDYQFGSCGISGRGADITGKID
jgi:hypothetical protein